MYTTIIQWISLEVWSVHPIQTHQQHLDGSSVKLFMHDLTQIVCGIYHISFIYD